MSPKPNWLEKVHYKLDNMFSKGTGMMIFWLGVLSLLIILIAAVIIVLLGITPEGESTLTFPEAFWQSMMRTLDPGTMGGDAGWGYRLVMLGVTLGGIFIISTLIGLISTGIETRIQTLQHGRSKVIEQGHTVILGWGEQIFTIIEELVHANFNQSDACVVVMGIGDKLEMEREIREKIDDTGNTRIVVRTGDPIEMSALDILNLNDTKAIIVLSPKGPDPDSEVIKTCLAITKNPKRKTSPFHIVAELRDPKNLEIAQIVGNGEIEWLLTGEIIARVIAQTCRQSGLSVVYTDFFDFAGDEIYFYYDPALVGRTFGEILNLFESNAVMGYWKKDSKPMLNPPMETVLNSGDQIFLLAEDDDQIFLSLGERNFIDESAIKPFTKIVQRPEKTLLLGWNWRAPMILRELDHYVPQGSQLTILCNRDFVTEDLDVGLGDFSHLSVTFLAGDTTDRSLLDSLEIEQYDHIVLLCYSDALTMQVADAHTLITLLHIRDIASKNPDCHFSITSEMLDIRNRNLAEVTRADDFIVSDKLISLMFAQIAEQKALNSVFADMFDPEGSEIYLKPAGDYLNLEHPVNFYTVIESARRRGEVALGYRIGAAQEDAAKSYGVVLNPVKSTEVTFNFQDNIIVVADH